MAVRVRGEVVICVGRGGRVWGAAAAAHVEAVLDEGDAEAGAGAVLGRVRGVEKIGEEETDELEGHADHGVPDKAEDGTDGETVDVNFVA